MLAWHKGELICRCDGLTSFRHPVHEGGKPSADRRLRKGSRPRACPQWSRANVKRAARQSPQHLNRNHREIDCICPLSRLPADRYTIVFLHCCFLYLAWSCLMILIWPGMADLAASRASRLLLPRGTGSSVLLRLRTKEDKQCVIRRRHRQPCSFRIASRHRLPRYHARGFDETGGPP